VLRSSAGDIRRLTETDEDGSQNVSGRGVAHRSDHGRFGRPLTLLVGCLENGVLCQLDQRLTNARLPAS
jgi:hypothetical protein